MKLPSPKRREAPSAPRRYTAGVVAEIAGCSTDALNRWAALDLIGPPVRRRGHGGGGHTTTWTESDTRAAWCLARINGKHHDQHAVVDILRRHTRGALCVTDADVVAGHPEAIIAMGADEIVGGRRVVIDLDEMTDTVARMLATVPAG